MQLLILLYTDQLFELGNGRTGTPTGDAGIVIEMGDDSNAFMGFDQSLGKFIVSRTNATGSSTGNLVHTTAPLVAIMTLQVWTLQRLLILHQISSLVHKTIDSRH